MNHSCADWRADLEASRDLTDLEKQNFGFLLAWFETWRLRQGLGLERESAVRFWREQVKSKERKDWQLERWAEAMRWQERWLALCASEGREPRGMGERLHRAVMMTGAKRGLALRTRQTYAGWMRCVWDERARDEKPTTWRGRRFAVVGVDGLRESGGGWCGRRGHGRFFLSGAVAGIDDDAGFFPSLDETGAGLGVGELEDEVIEIAEVFEEGGNIEH